jgi:hypothetical protein
MRLDAVDRTPTTAEFGDGGTTVATRSDLIPAEREDAARKEFGEGIHYRNRHREL